MGIWLPVWCCRRSVGVGYRSRELRQFISVATAFVEGADEIVWVNAKKRDCGLARLSGLPEGPVVPSTSGVGP
jgi:hypothetical protein